MKKGEKYLKTFLTMFFAAFIFCILSVHDVKAAGIKQISMGGDHSAAITSDGTLWMWGANDKGQLGNGNTKDVSVPTKIMTGVRQVSLGDKHSAVIKNDGSLWVWGCNDGGQVGNGESGYDKYVTSPVMVMSDVRDVDLGLFNTAAIKNDGSLWIWGSNTYGALGNGVAPEEMFQSTTPIQVMTNVKKVSVGRWCCAAIKTDGSLWTWGFNSDGQIGNETCGKNAFVAPPIQVMTGVKDVSMSWGTAAAVKNDGSLWIWGDNQWAQLGDGTTNDNLIPRKVLSGVSSVTIGRCCSAGLKADGSLWTWGSAYQVGNNVMYSTKPSELMTNVQSVDFGGNHAGAVKKDGTIWMWGNDYSGQLGDGRSGEGACSYTPIKIVITGSGNNSRNIADCEITLPKTAYSYTGKAIRPVPTVTYKGEKLKNKTDFVLSYKNNKKEGTATIIIEGKGTYSGKTQITFAIQKIPITRCSVTIMDARRKYTGKPIKPEPIVKYNNKTLKYKKDYKLTYKNNINPGTGIIEIKGKGKFSGTFVVEFEIVK